MAHVSHKLSNSFEGALAGGGDPATSPLYVFGPFLKLIVGVGVASVTFGPSIWLVVFTILMVSSMYRLVMSWVTDGSGGSGLSEEEFGGWAVKVNAAITFVEYTLTFLVSMAAMVTFIADRAPMLNETILGIQYRTIVAIVLSILTGWLVNRGPKTAARAFGPATAGVLALLWAMVFATIWQHGFQLPSFNLEAFSGEYLHFTFAGFTRMLAVMTGIEVFANLVAAYGGTSKEKSNRAFGSLLIIMGTTIATMLVVGPAIFKLSDLGNEGVSVFTQTMDALLPQPLPIIGTLIGIAVLLSASAASAQGLQNLALGLRARNYIPHFMGQRNKYDVADKPVWLEVGLVCVIFLLAGTNEETYLALYAAGVFVLLSMTGWAAAKRLVRHLREKFIFSQAAVLLGTAIAAAITSAATIVIFQERFLEGAWMYFVFIPLLFAGFTYVRNRMGTPSPAAERLGSLEGSMLSGFGYGQAFEPTSAGSPQAAVLHTLKSDAAPTTITPWQEKFSPPKHILLPLDGSDFAEQALPITEMLAMTYQAQVTFVTVFPQKATIRGLPSRWPRNGKKSSQAYLKGVCSQFAEKGIQTNFDLLTGPVAQTLDQYAQEKDIDMLIISARARSGLARFIIGSVANDVIETTTRPVLILQPTADQTPLQAQFIRILVSLDGSEYSERVLPYVKASAQLGSDVSLLAVPEIPEPHRYGAVVEEIKQLRQNAENDARNYLDCVAAALEETGVDTQVIVQGSRPAETIVTLAREKNVDVIMLATHGRGGLERLFMGSVADRVLQNAPCPVFLVPIQERRST